MRVTDKIIEDVVSEIAGKDIVPLVLKLKDKKNISEFALAHKMKLEINEARNMLYKLYDSNLVSFVKKKDKQKGWYVYYWTFNKKHIRYLISNLKKQRLNKLYTWLEREKNNNFFSCSHNCIRLDFEQATDFVFKCPECGELLNHEDNETKIKDLKEHIEKTKQELSKCVI